MLIIKLKDPSCIFLEGLLCIFRFVYFVPKCSAVVLYQLITLFSPWFLEKRRKKSLIIDTFSFFADLIHSPRRNGSDICHYLNINNQAMPFFNLCGGRIEVGV